MKTSCRHLRSISWFTIVGAIAALVHYLSAVIIESQLQLSPGTANLLAFLLAFPISYLGHRHFSFADDKATHAHSLPRFLLIASTGFILNQTLLLSLLKFSTLPFWLALAVVMIVVAVLTYLLSRHWAFRKN